MTCGDMRSIMQEAAVDFPEYDLRRAACARDPLVVVEAFRVHILLRLSVLLGVRNPHLQQFTPPNNYPPPAAPGPT